MAYPRQIFLWTYDNPGLWGMTACTLVSNTQFFMYKFAAVTATFSVVPVIERIWMFWIAFAADDLAQWSITYNQSNQRLSSSRVGCVNGRVDNTDPVST